jgi:hypothetical protein
LLRTRQRRGSSSVTSHQDRAWVCLFLFQVPSLRRNFSPAARSGASWGRENADQHPSLLPEHCTLASNVKARDSNVSNFLSSKLLTEKRREPRCVGQFFFVAANNTCCIAAQDRICLILRTSKQQKRPCRRAPLRRSVDRDMTLLDRSGEPMLRYNIHA